MNQPPTQSFAAPSDNWAAGHQPRKDSTLWVPAMIVGALIFAAGCGSGLAVGWMSGLVNLFDDFSMDAAITVVAESPETMTLGDTFELVVTITDTSGSPRLIEDIDFSGSLTDNADFVSITPTPQSVTKNLSYIEHTFKQSIAANGSTEIVFTIKPTQQGVYAADLAVYMDGYNSEHALISIEVTQE